jgi:hypothetical protein
MPTREHAFPLDDHARNWLRLRITTRRGRVTAFLVQYETTIDDAWRPVVRYDGAHGFAHRDVLNRRGDVIGKSRLPDDLSFGEALQAGERDLRVNRRRYRQAFFRGPE